MKKVQKNLRFIFFLIAFVVGAFFNANAQYAIGDYGSTASGNYSSGAIWSTWNGASWVLAGSVPSSGNNVFILAGRTVTFTVPQSCNSLVVESTGKLWTSNNPGNVYLSVYGPNLICNGQIGDGFVFDGISFGIEGANCTVTGTGQFDASRIRKSTTTATTTNLNINRDIGLHFNSASTTQLYNNCATASIFNVTVASGATVTFYPNGPNTGNVSIDGIDGVVNTAGSSVEAGGTYTINGTMNISGRIYMTTNNANPVYACKWIINGLVLADEVVAATSGLATHALTINNGGKLNLTGNLAWSTLSTTNNSYTFNNGSTVEYSSSGLQTVRVRSEFGGAVLNGYYDLLLSSSGNKQTLLTDLWVRNNLTITGSAVLDPNPAVSLILVGGHWTDYSNAGFNEKNTTVQVNGSGLQIITCPGGEVFNILRYQKLGSYVEFDDNVDIITQLWFTGNGYVDLNSNTLTIRNNGTTGINGQTATRYIYSEKTDNSSKVVWRIGTASALGPYTIPFGIPPGGAANYIPVIIYKTNASDIGDLSFATYGTPANNLPWPTTPTNVTNLKAYYGQHNSPDNRHWTVDRFWEVGCTSPTTIDSVRFSYRAIELPDSDANALNLGAQFWAGLYQSWNLIQYGVPAVNFVSVPNFQFYNTSWTLTSLISPLPIKLLSFDAVPEETQVDLKWITVSEINNKYFTVEKSYDGYKFFPIGTVEGAGNSTIQKSYHLEDLHPSYGISYYRLTQTDYDGTSTQSNTIPVSYKQSAQKSFVFPNPVHETAYLSCGDEAAEVIIRNVEGQLVRSIMSEKGTSLLKLDLSGLSEGIYMIEVKSNSGSQFLKVLKN